MSEAYGGKSDQQIIQEQAASLGAKEDYQNPTKFNPRNTVSQEEEQSNVNESGLQEFPGAYVSVGRTGVNGGGTNAQNIPPEEGGLDRSQVQGESSDRFEGLGGPEDKKREALANNPGGYEAHPRGIDQSYDRSANEVIPIKAGQELQPGQGIVADQAGQGSKADM